MLGFDDAERMARETGVDAAMIGRGALRDPWVFARMRARLRGAPAPVVGPAEALALHTRYRDDMLAGGAGERGTLGQLKQLYRRLEVALPIDEAARTALLRSKTIAELEAIIAALAQLPVRPAPTR